MKCQVTLVIGILFIVNCVLAQYDECGKTKAIINARIWRWKTVSHSAAMWPGMWPWQVGIKIKGRWNWITFCGGALIEPQWVLTAAHCFVAMNEAWMLKVTRNLTKYKVVAGDHNTNSYEDSEQERIPVEIHIHPGFIYNSSAIVNDIALIKLDRKVTLALNVRTVCLPNEDLAKPGVFGTATGWGLTESGSLSPLLRHSKHKIQDNDLCRNRTNFIFNQTVMFCAGDGKGHSDTCRGDSGGSVVREVLVNGQYRWVTIGIVSSGRRCPPVPGKYGYYTRLQPFMEWILLTKTTCGGTLLTDGNGTIMSPSYPSNYPKNKKCTWKITGPKGQRILLQFKDFKLEFGSANGNCRYDYVEVRDQHNKLLSRVCGTHIPKTITSPSNVMFVEFNSDHTQSKKGFAAMYYADEDECQENKGGCQHICVNTIGSYRCECKVGFALHNDHHSCKEAAECGATLTALTGVVTSPNYPGVYQHKKDCTWNIIVTPGSHILLSYRFVQIEEANDCRYDYVEAFSGTGSQAESLGRACGKLIPEPVMSKSFNMMIKFHSDALIAKRGFNARYDTYCGAKLHAVNQKRLFYSHPAYGDDTYSPFLKCTWTITAHNGTIIRLRFKEFDIESEKFCSYDVVTVHDGSNSTSPLLGKACGNDRNITREFLSTGNKMFVHFTTDVSIHKKGFIAEYVQVKNKKVDIKLEPIGCFKDLHVEPRPFSMRIGRFDDYDDFNETILYCGLAASKLSLKFFGIQENGECWGGNNDTYSINGPSTDCHNGVGKLGSLMVYRISGGCFPANAVLKLKTGAMATMETLRIGDEVQTLDTSTNEIFYTEVITFLHNEKRQGAFRVVEADDGNKLLISHEHLIYSGKTKDAMDMIYAEKIQPGDYLLSGNKTSRVISVKTVYDRGLYAPMTRHGTMLVNGIYVSCYVYYNPHGKVVYYNPHGIAHNLMTPLRLWYDVSHFLRDVLASIGMKLAVNDGLTGNEMSQGIHGYIRFLEALSKYLPQNLLVTVSKFETMISI